MLKERDHRLGAGLEVRLSRKQVIVWLLQRNAPGLGNGSFLAEHPGQVLGANPLLVEVLAGEVGEALVDLLGGVAAGAGAHPDRRKHADDPPALFALAAWQGAVAGGVLIGLAQELSTPFVGFTYKIAVGFLVLLAVLLVRPEGLFAKRTRLR